MRTAEVAATRRRPARRTLRYTDRGAFAALVVLTLTATTLMLLYPNAFPATVMMVPLLLTDLLLPPRRIPAFMAFFFVVLCAETAIEFNDGIPLRRWVAVGIAVVMAGILVGVSLRRNRLGVAGLVGDAMLLDLKDRINRQGIVPELPRGWHVDLATRAAGGTSFAGDFMVAHCSETPSELSLVLVDVSGKGVDAGTRSLLLSGAFGGLLGALPPAEFLPAANDFLLRQSWEEGFATAVHLSVDLMSGEYVLMSAGHPPAIQLLSGAGRWQVQNEAEGPILGLVPDAEFRPVKGHLGSGDALLLYTDGLVERPRRDIGLGIDKLVGEAERLVKHGFQGSAQSLVTKLGATADDCALAVLYRS